jgi:Ca2+:H+ antiporter
MKYLLWLLIFAPVALVARVLNVWPEVQFFTSALAVIPLAGVMSEATEELSLHTGPRLGGLLNATLGNAAELIITLFAIHAGLIELAKASITGSILGNVLLILGFSMLVGGLKNGEQRFNRISASSNATMLLIAVAALTVPSIFFLSHTESDGPVEWLSIGIAIIMLVIYLAGLLYAFRFLQHDTDEVAEMVEQVEGRWSIRKAVLLLLASTLGLALLSEVLVGAVERTVASLGMSEFFIGIILVPLVGNVAEHFVAVQAAWRNKMELSLAVSLGSSLQVALLVVPVLVFSSLLLQQPMTLIFNTFEIVALFLAVLIAAFVASDGRSNWLEGSQLLTLYVILGMAFFFLRV